MTEEEVKKIGFFKKMFLAIKDFDLYGVLAAENIWEAIKYLLKLMLIFVIVVSAVFLYQTHTSIQQGVTYFNENIEEIEFADNVLSVNNGEEITIQNDNSVLPYIVINTDATEEEISNYKTQLENYDSGLVILNDNIILKNSILSQNMEYSYETLSQNYQVEEFNKQDIQTFLSQIDYISLYGSIFIVMFIYLYVVYLASTFVDIIMLAVFGFIIARIAGMKIRFKATFNIGIYALTLPILLNLIYIVVNSLTGFTIQYFSWMYTTISYIYVVVAILMIKADLINRKDELMKIYEEQKKVREEIIRKEEEEKKEKENNKKDEPKDDKKKKEKNKDDDDLGDERFSTTRNKIILTTKKGNLV
jgi:hypothetical protein